jgi:hypothetical protein
LDGEASILLKKKCHIPVCALIRSEWHTASRWFCVKWVTRENVYVDRVACPWLIKRFVDPEAHFLFVPPDRIAEVEKDGAIPYDAKGVELGHHGDKCSFDAIIEKYKLSDPALLELAKIVRAADTDKAYLRTFTDIPFAKEMAEESGAERTYQELAGESKESLIRLSPYFMASKFGE